MPSRLLSIELQGYKTFANRIPFDFPGEITCIVGPNGSGKSNVADSIRWVLGEQSYNLLRARKTEDMIFSGSAHRPRAGMATVTITFDNSDGWFPIDFSEVSIMRRAYRDGQNEYLLNNQKVRLKDISDLLAQAGVTPRTYTIIGQGLVDAALSLRPDERRHFFEEAAGIGLHRRRREEAISRLDSTRRNLDRVLDIISELKPRLNSLEKQATRAREFEQISADLNVLMKEWYGYHWHRSQNELAQARKVLQVQEEQLNQIREKKQRVDSVLVSLRDERGALRAQLGGWHQQTAGLHKKLETLNRTIAVSDERLRSLAEQNNFSLSDQVRLEEEIQAAISLCEKYRVDQTELQNECDEIKKVVEVTEQKTKALLSQKKELEAEIARLNKRYTELETEKVKIGIQVQEYASQKESIELSHAKLTAEQEDLEGQFSQNEKVEKELGEELEKLQAQVKNAEKQLSEIRKEIQQDEQSLSSRTKELHNLENEKARKATQLDVIKNSLASNEHLSVDSQSIIKVLKKSERKKRIDSLTSMFKVAKGYEKAVAAGLGESIDALVLHDTSEVDEVLTLINAKEYGKVIFYHPSSAIPSDLTKIKQEKGVLGCALDFVNFDPSSDDQLIHNLLEDILLVDDRATAVRVISLVPKHVSVVTPDGEVFKGNGTIIAGHEQHDGVFHLKSRIDDMRVELDRLDKQISVLQKSVFEQQTELQQKVSSKQEIEKELAHVKESFERKSSEHRKQKMENAQVNQQLQYLQKRMAEMNAQKEQIVKKETNTDARMKEISAESLKIEGLLKENSRQVREIYIDDLQLELNHWSTRLAVIEKSLLDISTRITDSDHRKAELDRQMQVLRNRIRTSAEEISATEENQKKHRLEVETLRAEVNGLEEKIRPTEKKISQLEREISQKMEEQNHTQQRLTVSERHMAQAQLEVSRRNGELDNLRGKIEDDFGLVSFEYQREIVGPTPLPLDGLVDNLPTVHTLSADLEETISRQKAHLRRLGPINPDAQTEYNEVKTRYEYLTQQMDDLNQADADLRQIIQELDEIMKREFQRTFKLVAEEFKGMFTRLFGGGSARLLLLDEDNPTEAGIEIEAQLPGKRKQGLAVLSGGERSLTAVALIFALLKVSPTPFCVLDEVDAALDEANVGRFGDLLRELSAHTQFIVITHNRNTVQLADVIYGVTMARDSTSQVISLKLDEVSEHLVR